MADPQGPQFDLPPISVGRYFDLLKRRRWQVIPVSTVGLVVGALVAFLVPRYYVGKVTVTYLNTVLEQSPRDARKDPMADIVANAEVTIPQRVEEAIEELGWPEVHVADPALRRAFVTEVRDRLKIKDIKHKDRQTHALIEISYGDVIAQRAADLVNTLVGIWIAREEGRIRAQADRELEDINSRIAEAQTAVTNARTARRDFEREKGLDALTFRNERGTIESRLDRDLGERQGERDRLDRELEGLKMETALDEKQLASMEEFLPAGSDLNLPPEKAAALKKLLLELVFHQAAVITQTEAHQDRAGHLKRIKDIGVQVVELRGSGGGVGEPPSRQRNKPYDELARKIAGQKAKAAGKQEELVKLDQQIAAIEQKQRDLPDLISQYEVRQEALTVTEADRSALMTRRRQMQGQHAKIRTTPPIRVEDAARVQNRPTEPNITLVALAGSLAGLALAIGLILTIDFLQASFKTVSDVEHALSVPILGSISHMQTEEKKTAEIRGRRRVALVATVLVVLLVAVFFIYYTDPTLLPGPVRDVLSLILTEPGK